MQVYFIFILHMHECDYQTLEHCRLMCVREVLRVLDASSKHGMQDKDSDEQ